MRLDASYLHFISQQQLRVLTSIELGMKNHEWVPIEVIVRVARLRGGQAFKVVRKLLKNKFIVHTGKNYDGYKLAYLGYDYLALQTFIKRGILKDVICKIGVGKQSDIYKCITPQGEHVVLKLTRLGRTSFKTVKKNREYIQHRTNYNWLYLSRLSSVREFLFMQLLFDNGFQTPKPIDTNRHAVVMSLVEGSPLCHITRITTQEQVKTMFEQSLKILVMFAQNGLIHGDYNEFNLISNHDCTKLTVIDFPQCISRNHPNADTYFNRDVECVYKYFDRMAERTASEQKTLLGDKEQQGKFRLNVEDYPMPVLEEIQVIRRLDKELKTKGHITLAEEKQLANVIEENKDNDKEFISESEEEDEEQQFGSQEQGQQNSGQQQEQKKHFQSKQEEIKEIENTNVNHQEGEQDDQLENMMKQLNHKNLQQEFTEENNIDLKDQSSEEERQQFRGLTAYQVRQKIKAEKKLERQKKKQLMSEEEYIKNAVKRSVHKNGNPSNKVGNRGNKKKDKTNSQAIKQGYQMM